MGAGGRVLAGFPGVRARDVFVSAGEKHHEGSWPLACARGMFYISAGRRDLVSIYIEILPEPAEALVDQLPVDDGAAGFDDRAHMLAVVGGAARDGQVDVGAFGQGCGEIGVSFLELGVGKSCSLSTSHRVGLAQFIGHEIGHGAADSAEVEDSAGVLRELYSVEGGALDGAFDLVDGCVEAALVYLES